MKLNKHDQEFRNPKVFYPDPKNVNLDRVLINLFVLLRCDGQRAAGRGRPSKAAEKVETHADALAAMPGVTGFAENPEIAKAWLESDIFDLVNRGGSKEAVASLRPLHLDAHKVRIARNCRDYNHADAIYAMLEHGDRQALLDLREYLDRGRDAVSQHPDAAAAVDLDTITVIKLVEDLPDLHKSGEKVTAAAPLCPGQGRLLCDDVQRILTYRDEVPRSVMIDYLKTIMGLHLGMFILRLRRQLSGWIRDKQAHPTCLKCPVYGTKDEPLAECPYKFSLTVDMNSDYRSRMAQIAQTSATEENQGLSELVRAILTMNQLLRYAHDDKALGVDEDPLKVLSLLSNPPEQFGPDFRSKLKTLRQQNEEDEEALTAEEDAILTSDLDPFSMFIELVTHVRQKRLTGDLTESIDKLFQKNSDWGALVQGRSKGNPRRWHLGGRLLEVLVQLAVLKFDETPTAKRYRSEPILVNDFLHWVEARYGFVIGPSDDDSAKRAVTIDEHKAYRGNVRALKDRLREIGFYDDLSDAYNAQRIRPRYPIGHEGEP